MAFYQLEPWGCLVEDHRAELGLHLHYSINSKKGSKIPRFIDRDPESRVQEDQSDEELEQNILDFFAGKTIKAESLEEVALLPAPNEPRKSDLREPPAK